MEGGMGFGLSTVLFGAIDLEGGRIAEHSAEPTFGDSDGFAASTR
jgi:hypothetical protein